jgi:hypothetical protein
LGSLNLDRLAKQAVLLPTLIVTARDAMAGEETYDRQESPRTGNLAVTRADDREVKQTLKDLLSQLDNLLNSNTP